jgi:hypothetical protein
VRTDGSLGGYRWGLERKQSLLDQERRAAKPAHWNLFFPPTKEKADSSLRSE